MEESEKQDVKEKIEFNLYDTYIAAIKNSVGTEMFSEMYLNIDGEVKEVSENGRWACATYVSSVLTMFNLLKERHATMEGLMRGMNESGWYEISEPRDGAIIWWDVTPESEGHEHAGFYVGDNKAISNSWLKKVPVVHNWRSGTTDGEPSRPVKSIWWHDKLNN
ncbi:MAG: hypothetical protein WDZ39_00770 [Candidatus Spechtbacterales bacterium]